jgi:hypothetical protein
VKAWANILSAHLGRIKPKALLTVHCRSTAERALRANKTKSVGCAPPNPSPHFILHLHRPHSKERVGVAVWRNERSGGATDEAARQQARSSEHAAVEPSLDGALISAPRHGALRRRRAAVNDRGRCPFRCPSGLNPVVSRCGGDPTTRLKACP